METVLIGFLAGIAGAMTLNVVLSPFWELLGLRNRIHVELLLCSQIKPDSHEGLDLRYNAGKLRVLAAELRAFHQSASRLTRALVARRGYDLPAAVEAMIGLSNDLDAHAVGPAHRLERAKRALRLPEIGFPAGGDPGGRARSQPA